MELSYTPRDIKEMEDVMKCPISEGIADMSMKNLTLLVRKGLKVSEDEAFNEIGKYLEEGKDSTELFIEIVKRLEAQGFLSRSLRMSQRLEKKLKEMEQESIQATEQESV